jgi:hypothetical protein
VRGRPVGTLVGRGSRTSSNKNRAKGASTPKGGTGSIILPSRLSVIGSRNGAAASITARHALDVFESTSGEPPLDAAHGVRSLGSLALPRSRAIGLARDAALHGFLRCSLAVIFLGRRRQVMAISP